MSYTTKMDRLPTEGEVINKLVCWGSSEPTIRAMVLTSSRARPGGPVDLLSDYDLILAVTNLSQFAPDGAWVAMYGKPLVRWGDEGELCGIPARFLGVVYEDYVKIDYSLWPDVLLERVAEQAALPDQLDVGYRVLLDKDGRTSAWKPPAYKAHIPAKPTYAEFLALIEEFWWSATYVAKSLWRGEVMFAKFCLDHDIKLGVMRWLLEWRIELDHDWSLKPGSNGRGMEQLLPPDIWLDLAATYVGPEIGANWTALFDVTALFRRVATEVGNALGYPYPTSMDEKTSAYLKAVQALPPKPSGFTPPATPTGS
jgi:aminoglycoside 6-adenylyltransferase